MEAENFMVVNTRRMRNVGGNVVNGNVNKREGLGGTHSRSDPLYIPAGG